MAAEPARSRFPDVPEKSFYLEEFRGHTVCLAVSLHDCQADAGFEGLTAVLRELIANDSRVLLLLGVPTGTERRATLLGRLRRRLEAHLIDESTGPWFPSVRGRRSLKESMLDLSGADWQHALSAQLVPIWTTLRSRPLLVGLVEVEALTRAAERIAGRLRVHKLVFTERAGGIAAPTAGAISFMDETMLTTILNAGQAEWAGVADRRPILGAILAALRQEVTTVNLCSLDELARELFTYEGSGTLFTREDYCHVQRLGIDDFDQVERLILRGQHEGFLKPRDETEIARILLNGFGATIGSRHLAGVCGLETDSYRRERAGEIVCLYTITRFKTEGVGHRLLDRVVLEAQSRGLRYVFACTTNDRAQEFFQRSGFRSVRRGAVPTSKWAGYDQRRSGELKVMRREVEAEQLAGNGDAVSAPSGER